MFAPRISRPRFTNFREHVSIGQTLTVPNFVTLQQKMSEISAVENFCSRKSGPKFTCQVRHWDWIRH